MRGALPEDLDALIAIYFDDVQHVEALSTLAASDAAQVSECLNVRLRAPDLHARLVNRIVMGNIVIDQEVIAQNFSEPEAGLQMGTVDLIAMYEAQSE